MIKRKLLLLISLMISATLLAQQTDEADNRKSDHYVGVQANQLIRQLLNFSGSSSVANSPYLLVYSVNSRQTGWGFTSGLGYTHNEFTSGDPLNATKSTINDFALRIGFEKKTWIGKKWILGSGIDVIIESESDETKNSSQFGSVKVETSSKGFGLGPRATLIYSITNRILIGTEATYYFKSIKEEQKIDDVSQGGEDKQKQFSFGVPAVLFLYVKF